MLALTASACASAPPPAPPPAPTPPSFEQKSAWILRLEDKRILREASPPAPPPVVPASPERGRSGVTVAARRPPPPPDRIRLLTDNEARIRRRAALAVGRVGLVQGVEPLIRVLNVPDPEVRQMAAFALGLIGDKSARDALIA